MNALLAAALADGALKQLPRGRVVGALREELDVCRAALLSDVGAGAAPSVGQIVDRMAQRLIREDRSRLQRVINATGIVIHTNLGRSPMAASAIKAVAEAASSYSNLEFIGTVSTNAFWLDVRTLADEELAIIVDAFAGLATSAAVERYTGPCRLRLSPKPIWMSARWKFCAMSSGIPASEERRPMWCGVSLQAVTPSCSCRPARANRSAFRSRRCSGTDLQL